MESSTSTEHRNELHMAYTKSPMCASERLLVFGVCSLFSVIGIIVFLPLLADKLNILVCCLLAASILMVYLLINRCLRISKPSIQHDLSSFDISETMDQQTHSYFGTRNFRPAPLVTITEWSEPIPAVAEMLPYSDNEESLPSPCGTNGENPPPYNVATAFPESEREETPPPSYASTWAGERETIQDLYI